MQQYMKLMGLKAKDSVTGFTGVVECVSFDLYGCVQVTLRPEIDKKDGKPKDAHWFDHKRIEVLGKRPVMQVPNFNITVGDERGPASKPAMTSTVAR